MYLEVVADYDFLLIGSGPTATAALGPLAESNRSVIVIDISLRPSSQLQDFLSDLGGTQWSNWSTAARNSLVSSASSGMAPKKFFGESFPYDSRHLGIDYRDSFGAPRASVARGGFSTVWGATVLPFPLGAWPNHAEDQYREILSAVGELTSELKFAGESGPIDLGYPGSMFTHPIPSTSPLTALARGEAFFEKLGPRSFASLGLPRLAVAPRAATEHPHMGCTSCGLCQVGCVYGHIWNSARTFEALVKTGQVTQLIGQVVCLEDTHSNSVKVYVRQGDSGIEKIVRAKHVLIAAGPISTASLLIRSGLIDSGLELKDSQTFFVGGFSRTDLSPSAHSTTLTEVVSVAPSQSTDSISHFQVYGPSDYLQSRIFGSNQLADTTPKRLREAVSGHLAVCLGYLDSSESSIVRVFAGNSNNIYVRADPKIGRAEVKMAVSAHKSNLRRLGIHLIPSSLQILPVGGGNHLGASIPMTSKLDDQQRLAAWSDDLGRPFGHGSVHILDTSVLPSVPAGPITLMAMGNARRIARRLVNTR